MIKSLLGIAPQQEPDGSFRPSKVALKLATSDTTDYEPIPYAPYGGTRRKVVVVFTEQKNMEMQNGEAFSTGNHPVEALVPMLHLKNAGFEFEIATPSGKPVVFEMWAMPREDQAVVGLYDELKARFDNPRPLQEVVDGFQDEVGSYAAVFVPGGHGAMLGIPQDPNVGTLLRLAHEHDLFTISLCHGPGSFLATALEGHAFLYSGYNMAVFPDSVDKMTPRVGYLPGQMPWRLGERLTALGARIVNTKSDKTCVLDRRLITGASPLASNELGKLAATTLLEQLA
ncbi:glyoxalase III HchA [Rubrivirga sp. IMCC43871]|uniref:glyoxalase III HchA n=1 Tax=Rubrivirga sp. IMCC43871 TaxID=3391575 RepID=UPI003990135D